MVKFNEALIIGGTLLAALVLSKGSSILPRTASFSPINTDTAKLSQTQASAIQQGESNIATLQNIKKRNLEIAQDILDYEENITNTKIDYLQTEISKTQSFISQQQKIANPPQLKIGNKGVLSQRISDQIVEAGGFWNFYNLLGKGEVAIKPEYYTPVQEVAEMKIAANKIEAANKLIFAQQAEISRLQEEYDTRFGSLSRYG